MIVGYVLIIVLLNYFDLTFTYVIVLTQLCFFSNYGQTTLLFASGTCLSDLCFSVALILFLCIYSRISLFLNVGFFSSGDQFFIEYTQIGPWMWKYCMILHLGYLKNNGLMLLVLPKFIVVKVGIRIFAPLYGAHISQRLWAWMMGICIHLLIQTNGMLFLYNI